MNCSLCAKEDAVVFMLALATCCLLAAADPVCRGGPLKNRSTHDGETEVGRSQASMCHAYSQYATHALACPANELQRVSCAPRHAAIETPWPTQHPRPAASQGCSRKTQHHPAAPPPGAPTDRCPKRVDNTRTYSVRHPRSIFWGFLGEARTHVGVALAAFGVESCSSSSAAASRSSGDAPAARQSACKQRSSPTSAPALRRFTA